MKIRIIFLLSIISASCAIPQFTTENKWERSIASEKNSNIKPIQNVNQLEVTTTHEKVYRLKNAKIVYADYHLIRKDFPQISHLTDEKIDEWLLDNAALMSENQLKQTNANGLIPVTEQARSAFRPAEYGRALVFPVSNYLEPFGPKELHTTSAIQAISNLSYYLSNPSEWDSSFDVNIYELQETLNNLEDAEFKNKITDILNKMQSYVKVRSPKTLSEIRQEVEQVVNKFTPTNGLIDAKGVGSLAPKPGGHSDGLMTLGEGIREYIYEKMINKVLVKENSGLSTVGSYAVIDGGFDVKHADGSSSPGGIYLRQAHVRYKSKSSLLDDAKALQYEKMFRKYGITTAGAYRQKYNYDMINVQGTKDGAILDFGGFLVVDKMRASDAKNFYGVNNIILANQVTQPDPHVRIPFEIWGTTVSKVEDPKNDNIWLWSHELATALREGRASRADANNHFNNFLNPVNQIFKSTQTQKDLNCPELIGHLINLK
jgi:hypothetical protein